MKRCSRCGETKPVAEFYTWTNGKPRGMCKPCLLAYNTEWRERNPEALRASRAKRRDKDRELQRRWYEAHRDDPAYRDMVNARSRAWREANRERHRENARRWQLENPERHRASTREHARRRRLGQDADAIAFAAILRRDPCAYCGGPAGEIDHIIAIDQGGPNTWDNLTAACKNCNSQKRTIPLLPFLSRV
jgi:5-methylcytosine-specific restriction endonuclease McrA